MFCTQCGNSLITAANFCPMCGAKADSDSAVVASATVAPALIVNDDGAILKTSESQGDSSQMILKRIGIFATCLLAMVAIGYVVTGRLPGFDRSSASGSMATSTSVGSLQHRTLDAVALRLLSNSEVGLGGLCEKTSDEKLTDAVYGTIAAGTARLPAIKAHYDFMCVSQAYGTWKRMTEAWVVAAIDDAGGVRCIMTAKREVVDEVASGCDFQVE